MPFNARCLLSDTRLASIGLLLGSFAVFVAVTSFAPAQAGETILYNFLGSPLDGIDPYAGLIFDAHGALYGTTVAGGSGTNPYCGPGCGTVFKLTPPDGRQTQWTETVLYSFQSGTDGALPFAGLIFDCQGALYGTTYNGGSSSNCPASPGSPSGCGTVFKLTPPDGRQTQWTETVLYSFPGGPGPNGQSPEAGLIIDKQGALYGTTPLGGVCTFSTNFGCGTVFQLKEPY
jgi:uncharacterized protein YceK